MSIPRTRFITSAHLLKNNTRLVLLMMSAGGVGMSILLLLQAGVGISMIGLIVPMLVILLRFSGKAEYTLNENGISRVVVTTLGNKHSFSLKPWGEIKYYKQGADLNRSLREYNYLELTFRDGEVWKVTDDGSDKEVFQGFLESFEMVVHRLKVAPENAPVEESRKRNVEVIQPENKTGEFLPPPIQQRKTFYERGGAKVFFWGMVIVLMAIAGIFLTQPKYFHSSHVFRISFILIPGMMYLYFRLYRKVK